MVTDPTDDAVSHHAAPKVWRTLCVARARAAVAVLWTIVYLIALHGRQIAGGSTTPVLVGLLLAVYPLIDAVASVAETSPETRHLRVHAGAAIDGLAVVGLVITTLGLDARSVLIGFGAWALVSGLLQLTGARRAHPTRRRPPLVLSGAISAIAGLAFAVTATEHVAHLSYLAGYAVLGAVFFTLSSIGIRAGRLPTS